MPTIKDKITGKVISRQPYNQEGIQNAATIAESNPKWEVSNAMDRSEKMYAGGGKIGYNVPEYKKGVLDKLGEKIAAKLIKQNLKTGEVPKRKKTPKIKGNPFDVRNWKTKPDAST